MSSRVLGVFSIALGVLLSDINHLPLALGVSLGALGKTRPNVFKA